MDEYEEKFYTDEELVNILAGTKKFLDRTHLIIKNSRYGKVQADRAIIEFFTNNDLGSFPNFPNENIKKQFEELSNHYYEIYQILIDFAISSYISDKKKGIEQDIPSLEEINSYIDEKNNNLNYDPKHVTKIVALMAAQSKAAIAFTVETLACNRKLKEVLVKEFVASRYSNYERRKELDDTPTSCEVNINDKERLMSKTTLNRNIATLNADDEQEFFNPNSNNPTGVSPQSRLQ